MKISIIRNALHGLVFAIAILFALQAVAATRPQTGSLRSAGAGAPLAQAYEWYDGAQKRTVWVNPQVVAEFNPGKTGARAVVKADANARVLPLKRPQAGIRMWQMDNSNNAAVRSMASANPGGKYSPVFHDGPNSGASMRALPGNVIIYLDPAWDDAAVNAWLKKRSLQVVKKLNIGSNIYVIKTGAGIEALDTANALYQSGEVKAAFPEWWQEVTTR